MKVEFLDRLEKNTKVLNFMKIHPVGAELSHADGQTRDEANSRFLQFSERV